MAADRLIGVSLQVSTIVLLGGVIAWLAASRRWFAGDCPGFGWPSPRWGVHHRQYRDVYPADDIGHVATEEPRLVRLRGRLVEPPATSSQAKPRPIAVSAAEQSSRGVLAVTHWQAPGDWLPVSGRVRLTVGGRLDGLRAGDEVEAVGWLSTPPPPMNPGETDDNEDRLRDERIRAVLTVRKTSDGVVRLAAGTTLFGGFDAVRGWGRQVFEETLPPDVSGLAAASLLGDTSALAEEWDKYVRTGVVHALAISGQHLVVLSGISVGGLATCRSATEDAGMGRHADLIAYALLTGRLAPRRCDRPCRWQSSAAA